MASSLMDEQLFEKTELVSGVQLKSASFAEEKPRILLVANTAWYLYNFRRDLARQLQSQGYAVTAVAPHDKYADLLVDEGIPWVDWHIDRRGINPLREVASTKRLREVYIRLEPDLIHHFTVKCVIYGTAASRGLADCRVVNTVTGLGHLFLSDSLKCRVARPVMKQLYRWALTRKNVQAMFQNEDDALVLLGKKGVERSAPTITIGSGVDLQAFAPRPAATRSIQNRPLRVMFVGRVVREKGIFEFVEAARLIHQRGLDVEFVVCGERDLGNRSVVDDQTFEEWEQVAGVHFLGHQEDMAEVMQSADIVVLPSYREGTPRTLMEASAMGKPIVATDVPGCRNVAHHDQNALLVPAKDPGALTEAIAKLVEDESLRQRLGEGGKRLALRYDVRHINQQILGTYALSAGSPVSRMKPTPVLSDE